MQLRRRDGNVIRILSGGLAHESLYEKRTCDKLRSGIYGWSVSSRGCQSVGTKLGQPGNVRWSKLPKEQYKFLSARDDFDVEVCQLQEERCHGCG
jgi:hypothetical protein